MIHFSCISKVNESESEKSVSVHPVFYDDQTFSLFFLYMSDFKNKIQKSQYKFENVHFYKKKK